MSSTLTSRIGGIQHSRHRNGDGNGKAHHAAPTQAPATYTEFVTHRRIVTVTPLELSVQPAPFMYPPGLHVAPFFRDGQLVLVAVEATGRLAGLYCVGSLGGTHSAMQCQPADDKRDIEYTDYRDIELVNNPYLFTALGHPQLAPGVHAAPWLPRRADVAAEFLVIRPGGQLDAHLEVPASCSVEEAARETAHWVKQDILQGAVNAVYAGTIRRYNDIDAREE